MNTKKVWIAVVVIAIIAIIGWFVPVGQNGQTIVETLGAVPTLDGVDHPYVTINGVKTYNYSQFMAATSSVVCSVKNPFNATSTLNWYSAIVTSKGNISQIQFVDVSTSTTALASSSPAFLQVKLGGSLGHIYYSINATTTNTRLVGLSKNLASTTDAIVGPSEYVNMKIATGTPGTFGSYWTGTCQGQFTEF